MATLDRLVDTYPLPGQDVPKKKQAKSPTDQGVPPVSHQMNIRVPDGLYVRIEETAAALGLDATNFLRMVIKENLAQYEQRAEQIRGTGKKC